MERVNRISLTAHVTAISIMALAFFAAYHDVLKWMYGRYTGPDSYYSHGFIVPVICGYFIWKKREELKAEKLTRSWWGLVLILAASIIHVVGTGLYVFSISGFSILLFTVGTCLFVFGKNITRRLWFPLVFMVFMLPLPMVVIGKISFPMKMLVVEAGTRVVRTLGIPALREGFYLKIPSGELLIGNPCSGLRSLIAFLALGAIYAYVSHLSDRRKLLLFLSSIPIALLSNLIRVPVLVLIAEFWGLLAASPDSFLHTASGVMVFVVGLAILYLCGRVLEWGK